jgi:hypothetical protein
MCILGEKSDVLTGLQQRTVHWKAFYFTWVYFNWTKINLCPGYDCIIYNVSLLISFVCDHMVML